MSDVMPKRLAQLVEALLHNGWNFQIVHGKDTGDSPFVSVEALKAGREHLCLTWHTRASGRYRLFSCMAGKHDITLGAALDEVTS